MSAASLATLNRLHGHNNLAAAGANQGAATAIAETGNFVVVTSGTTGQGIRLPAAPALGDWYLIKIAEAVSANPLSGGGEILLYPGTGGKLSHRPINVSTSIYAFQSWFVHCTTAGGAPVWECLPINGMVGATEISHSFTENYYRTQNVYATLNMNASIQHFGNVADIWTGAVSGYNKIQFPDNLTEAFYLGESTTRYLNFRSTDTTERVEVRKNFLIDGVQQSHAAPSVISTSGVAVATIDWNTGNIQAIDLQGATGDVTLTLSNPGSGYASYVVKVIQGSTPRNLIWPGSVLKPGGVAPTISTADNAIDVMYLIWDGANYLLTFQQAFA